MSRGVLRRGYMVSIDGGILPSSASYKPTYEYSATKSNKHGQRDNLTIY